MTDDRVVLPLSRVQAVARRDCNLHCPPWPQHAPACLVPDLELREVMLAQAVAPQVTPDCRDSKHTACTGCPCLCHTRGA